MGDKPCYPKERWKLASSPSTLGSEEASSEGPWPQTADTSPHIFIFWIRVSTRRTLQGHGCQKRHPSMTYLVMWSDRLSVCLHYLLRRHALLQSDRQKEKETSAIWIKNGEIVTKEAHQNRHCQWSQTEKKNVKESIAKMNWQSWTYTSHLHSFHSWKHCVYRHFSVISSIYESLPYAGFYFADQVK